MEIQFRGVDFRKETQIFYVISHPDGFLSGVDDICPILFALASICTIFNIPINIKNRKLRIILMIP